MFAVHGVGGIVGNLLTGIFAQKTYGLGAIEGGWLDGNWEQMLHQLADTAAGLGWSFGVTFLILFIMNKIPGLSLRVDSETERVGIDLGEHGVSCYEHVEEIRVQSRNSTDGLFQYGNMAFAASSQSIPGNGTHVKGNANNFPHSTWSQIEQSRL